MAEKHPLLVKRTGSTNHVLVIHGGAGAMLKDGSSPEQQAKYHAALRAALHAGNSILRDGGEAMDAAVAAVTVMEDCPLFNSGKGAVFNVAGKNELETSIMLSKPPASRPGIPTNRRGLSLTLLTRARNPASLARALYLSPDLVPHTMMSGDTAEWFGESLGEQLVDPSYFFTEHRWREHRRGLGLPEEPFPPGHEPSEDAPGVNLDQLPTGTVGAVALDCRGCIASVTSTGGRTNKLVGRVGDTPQMGAGFWAEEWRIRGWWRCKWKNITRHRATRAVGISGTGDGDYYIRLAAAATIGHRMKFLNESVRQASKRVVQDLFQEGGIGGVIALDDKGQVATPLNCPGMYRGLIRDDGIPKTAIFNDEILE